MARYNQTIRAARRAALLAQKAKQYQAVTKAARGIVGNCAPGWHLYVGTAFAQGNPNSRHNQA
jgi:hypothetical protein